MVEVSTPNPAKPHRPTWQRRTPQAAVLLAGLLAVWLGGRYLWRHFSLYNTQRACLTYTAPPTDVVFETDNAAATALYAAHHDSLGFFGPEGHASFGSYPSCKSRFAGYMPIFADGPLAVIFLHERIGRGPGGQRRLLEICFKGFIEDTSELALVNAYSARVWEPASLFSEPRWIESKQPRPPQWPNIALPTRIYAGQADPADASHFTFDYEANGTRDTVDGWLEADDSVTLTPRHPPLPPATAPSTEDLPRK